MNSVMLVPRYDVGYAMVRNVISDSKPKELRH